MQTARYKPRKMSVILSVITTQEQRNVVENYANKKQLSLSEASRELIAAGAKALKIDNSEALTQIA